MFTTTTVMMLALLSSAMFVEVESFQLSSTSSSNPHFVGSLLPGNFLQPRQPHNAPLFASTDGDETSDSSTSSSTTTTFATATESIGDKIFAELDKMRQQFSELTESLSMAKEREEQAQANVARLAEEKVNVEAEKESTIARKKRLLRYVFYISHHVHIINYLLA
jgi:hypothetical protein